jgi:hypothetical protein
MSGLKEVEARLAANQLKMVEGRNAKSRQTLLRVAARVMP